MSEFSDTLALVALIGAAIAALGVIAKGIQAAAHWIVRMSAAAQLVMYELQPNAGTSLKDTVERIDIRVEALEAWRKRHDGY